MIFAASGLALAALIYLLSTIEAPRPDCMSAGNVPDNHTIILVDQTDELSPDQISYVKQLVMAEYIRLQEQDAFTLVGLNPLPPPAGSPPPPERLRISFTRCRVALGAEAVEWRESRLLIDQAFRQSFGAPVTRAFDAMTDMPPAANSPIMEEIDRLAQLPSFNSPSINRRLVIISDMAQYTAPGVSHYPPSDMPNARFRMPDNTDFGASSNLDRVTVRVHYLRRDDLAATQTSDHPVYWERYFRNSGVTDFQLGWGFGDDSDQITPLPPQRDNTPVWIGDTPHDAPAVFSPTSAEAPLPSTRALSTPANPVTAPAIHAISVRSELARLGSPQRDVLAYYIDWPSNIADAPRFDALRFVMFVSNGQCPVSFASTSNFVAQTALPELSGRGRMTRALSVNVAEEARAIERLRAELGLHAASLVRCDAFSARLPGRDAVRQLRCGAQIPYAAIADTTWESLARSHALTSNGALGIRSGIAQSTPSEVDMIQQALGRACGPAPTDEARLLQGLHLQL